MNESATVVATTTFEVVVKRLPLREPSEVGVDIVGNRIEQFRAQSIL
jgi:hypothetical protein